MLDELIQRLERQAGSAALTIQRPRPHQWTAVLYRDAPRAEDAIYCSGDGDTLSDAVHDLLSDPVAAA